MSKLQIDVAGPAFEPGAEIDVELSWELDAPCDALELRLVWNTSGKGDSDLEVISAERIDAPSLQESKRLTITLPRSPYSFSGKLVSLIWALEFVTLPKGESRRKEIVIAPGGREVLLTSESLE